MLKEFKNTFTYNISIVFAGTSLANFFNLLYQLLIAHRLSVSDFAAFNSLLSIFMVISAPLGTLQMAIVKYCAEFNARKEISKVKFLLSDILRKNFILAIPNFLISQFILGYLMEMLKISSIPSRYILATLLALSWIIPIFSGGVQGLELFGWLTSASLISGALKLVLTFLFILFGFNVAGALGALLASSLIGLLISYLPLRKFISLKVRQENVSYKEIVIYFFPVAISSLCFIALVSFDMILVKYFFSQQEAGLYSLAQMVGKIFLFLPGAISIVMFPRAAGLNANNLDTRLTLKKSLLYGAILCISSALVYNLFPDFILKVLTGKEFSESITLGRLFSISMSFFALLYILLTYFLSIKDLRFIKYLTLFTGLQFFALALFHRSLIQVQLILCINAILLFAIHLVLTFKKGLSPKGGLSLI